MSEKEKMEKEIARQMGYEDVDDALEYGDWSKVDPELVRRYEKYSLDHFDDMQYGGEQ